MSINQSKLIDALRQEDSHTFNNAVTNSTSLNNIVDLFFIAGASRVMSEGLIKSMISRSWVRDPLLTLKLIFWAGDIRSGQGERRFFRISLKWIEDNYPNALLLNIKNVPEFNRWDSLFTLSKDKTVFENILLEVRDALNNKNGLCAKWMPRKKQYDNFGDKFRRYFQLDLKTYRKIIVELSKTIEQQMCKNEWDKIEYQKVPSVAMNKYRKIFLKRNGERFKAFIEKVEKGEEKINASVLYPYNLYQAFRKDEDKKSIDVQWQALPNYMKDSNERILPVCDVSGSMTTGEGLPMDISVSLGTYISERNIGIFKDAFVTFSGSPSIQYLKGTVCQRFEQLSKAEWERNTNLDAVFELILEKAKQNQLQESEMPTMILIISDMEFDECGTLTNYNNIKQKYESSGYEIPKIVFWNVNGREGNLPTNYKEKNVGLVSGASPSIISSILGGEHFDPESIMLKTLNNKRYDNVMLAPKHVD